MSTSTVEGEASASVPARKSGRVVSVSKALPFINPVQPEPVLLLDEPLFHDSRAAIRFAFTGEGEPKRPASSRLLDKTGTRDRGIGGTDAEKAAQMGMIQSVLRPLGDLLRACVIASSCPPSVACPDNCNAPCCSGKRISAVWHDAISKLAVPAKNIQAQDGSHPLSRSSYVARSGVLLKFFGGGTTLSDIAKQANVDDETIGRYHRAVVRWMRGQRAGKNGEPSTEGILMIAWRETESLLRNAGIVGS